MTPARTILAVLLGYLTFLILEVLGAIVTASVLRLSTGAPLLISGEVVTFIAAIVGGGVAARVARDRPLEHAAALGLSLFTVTVLVTIITPRPAVAAYPGWFPYVTAVFGGLGAFVGGALFTLARQSE